MGRELQKRKRRSSRPAVRQRSSTRSKLTKNPLGNSIIARNWNKNETTTQNYRRLGLVSRLRAPTGGVEPKLRPSSSASTSTSTTAATIPSSNPFAINAAAAARGPATTETRVERDASGKIVRVIDDDGSSSSKPEKRPNPLNDPLVEFDTDSEAPSEAEEWDGFGGNGDRDGEENEVVRQLEAEARRPVEKRPRTTSVREAEWLRALVDRHGDDAVAMARDHKLNPMQQTAADIARRIRKWRGEGGGGST